MPIPFQCSGCEFKTKVKDELAGKKIKCPKCGTAGVIKAATQGTQDLMKLNLDSFEDVAPEEGRNADGTRVIDPKAKKRKKKKKLTGNELDSTSKGLALVCSLISAGVIAFLAMNVAPVVMENINIGSESAPPAPPPG